MSASCELCTQDGGEVLWRSEALRVVLVADRRIPGFCRVITSEHVAEATDLPERDRDDVMRAVFATERALRDVLAPDKINLASLGNVVPHLHWHVIPRWRDDAWFPDPIWAPPRRDGAHRTLPATERNELVRRLAALIRRPA